MHLLQRHETVLVTVAEKTTAAQNIGNDCPQCVLRQVKYVNEIASLPPSTSFYNLDKDFAGLWYLGH